MSDSAGELPIKSELRHDGQGLITVSDTGVGLLAEKAEQSFNTFFTTKPQGSSMGLNLPLDRRIARPQPVGKLQ